MPRCRNQRYNADPRPLTSQATYAAVRAVLTDPRYGWTEGRDFRLRPTVVSADEIYLCPLMPDPDTLPGCEPDIIEGFLGPIGGVLRRTVAAPQVKALTDAGWSTYGEGSDGVYLRRPGPEPGEPSQAADAADLASAPAGAPGRLLAIAADLGIGNGDLDEAVYEVAHEAAADTYNNGAHPAPDDERAHAYVHAHADVRAREINNGGLSVQLAFLYQDCVSEAAFRALLRDLTS